MIKAPFVASSLTLLVAPVSARDVVRPATEAMSRAAPGLARDEVLEAIAHLASHAGWPKAFGALPVAARAMAAAEPATPRR